MDLLELLNRYKTENENETIDTNKFIDFYKKNWEKWFYRNCTKWHFTWSIFVINEDFTKVLLMHHKKLNKWMNFWWHADWDNDIVNVAIRELEEESGIKIEKEDLEDFLDLDLQVIPQRLEEPEHYHYDFRFLVSIKDDTIFNKQDAEVNDIKWINISDLKNYNKATWVDKIINKLITWS